MLEIILIHIMKFMMEINLTLCHASKVATNV